MIRNQQGSVTTFFLVVLIAIIFFDSVLIDVTRVLTYRHGFDQFVEAEYRSIHTKYNKKLAEYGLYGISNFNTLKHQFESNLLNEKDTDDIVVKQFTSYRKMNNSEVLQNQIFNEMKWRAPLEWSFLIIDKVKKTNLSEKIAKSRNTAKNVKELENLNNQLSKKFHSIHTQYLSIFSKHGYIDTLNITSRKMLTTIDNQMEYQQFLLKWNTFILKLKDEEILLRKQFDSIKISINEMQKIEKKMKEQWLGDSGNFNQYAIGENNYIEARLEIIKIEALISGLNALIYRFEQRFGAQFEERKREMLESLHFIDLQRESIFSNHEKVYSSYTLSNQSDQSKQKKMKNQILQNYNNLRDILHSCPSKNFISSINKLTVSNLGLEALTQADKALQVPTTFSEKMYNIEFALSKFNYRTFKGSDEKPFLHRHFVQNSEIEQVLFGMNKCELNQAAMTSEIFLMRIAIRITELLMTNKSTVMIVSPWLFLLQILTKASYIAVRDTKTLVLGKEIPLFTKSPYQIQINYMDHLRLFMYLHGSNQQILSRIAAIIQTNTGEKFSNITTSSYTRVKYKRKNAKYIYNWWGTTHEVTAKFAY